MAGKTINVTDEASLLKSSGMKFLGELRQDGARPDAPESMRNDWGVVAGWLGHSAGELSAFQSDKLERAWVAYLAIGLAPSFELQSAFSHYSEQFSDVPKSDRAPTEVMNVFDRLLATDDKIKAKRAADWKAEEERFRPLFAKLKGEKQPSWWRRQPPLVRNWIFSAAVWAVFMFVYAFFFDAFDTGGWYYMDDDETMRFVLIVLAPVGAGAVFYAYRRWVR
jgi:nitroreductase